MERPVVDHLVFASPDLEEGIRHVEALLGMRASPGGVHPGMGTRNALLGLGEGCYLEIVGIDPDQPAPAEPRWFGIDGLEGLRLVTFAARVSPGMLDGVVAEAAASGVDLGEVRSGGRVRPDGGELRWKVTSPRASRREGVLPFLMEWGTPEHPSSTLAVAGSLVSLRAEHPEADAVIEELVVLGVDLPVRLAPRPALVATLQTAGGVVELR